MKFTINITDIDASILENEILDIEQWANNALIGKINACKKRMVNNALPELLKDPSVTNIPATEDEVISLVTGRAGYKNRAARDRVGHIK